MTTSLADRQTDTLDSRASYDDAARGSDTLRGGSRPATPWRTFVALDPNGHRGLYGESYVYLLASAAGLTAGKQNLDVDGVDWLFAYPGPKGTKRSPKLEIQVKTTSSPEQEGEYWKYRLSVKRFNKIAGSGFDTPRFFGLVIAPKNPDDYAVCGPDSLIASHAAYWISFAEREPLSETEEAAQSIGFLVPKKNLLTPQSLLRLIDGDLEGATT